MNRIGKIAILLCSLVVTATAYAESDLPSPEKRLTPTIATYLDLLMCANTAEEFQSDPALASGYRNSAFALADKAEESGWSDDVFDSTLIAVQESYRELEISDQDTREDWQRRHFAGQRCQQQITAAANYLEQGVPAPDS